MGEMLPTCGPEGQTANMLRTLSPREEKIIKMRYGLEDGLEHTPEEVGGPRVS